MPPDNATRTPINLTEAAGSMAWSEVSQALGLLARANGAILEIRALAHAEDGHANDGLADTVYVIVSGYGLLRSEERNLECTGGDVVFMPSGHPHHFERMDGEIRIWRNSLASVVA